MVNVSQASNQENLLYKRLAADGQVKATAGFVHTASVAPTTASVTAGMFTLYDSLTESGTIIYQEWIIVGVVGHSIILDVPFNIGLYLGFDATLANAQVTVSYN